MEYYAQQAINNGASYVIIDQRNTNINDKTILVEGHLGYATKTSALPSKFLQCKSYKPNRKQWQDNYKELYMPYSLENIKTIATVGNLKPHWSSFNPFCP